MIKKLGRFAIAGFAVLAFVAVFAVVRSVHADDNGNSGDNGSGTSTQVQTENHGSVVSQVARENENGSTSASESENHGSVVSQVASENENGASSQSTSESVSLKANGDFSVTGATVNSVDASSTSANVTFYGYTRTVSFTGAVITGGGQAITIDAIKPGDILSATGNFNETTHVLTVLTVDDVSVTSAANVGIQAQINSLLQFVQKLQAQLSAMLHG